MMVYCYICMGSYFKLSCLLFSFILTSFCSKVSKCDTEDLESVVSFISSKVKQKMLNSRKVSTLKITNRIKPLFCFQLLHSPVRLKGITSLTVFTMWPNRGNNSMKLMKSICIVTKFLKPCPHTPSISLVVEDLYPLPRLKKNNTDVKYLWYGVQSHSP